MHALTHSGERFHESHNGERATSYTTRKVQRKDKRNQALCYGKHYQKPLPVVWKALAHQPLLYQQDVLYCEPVRGQSTPLCPFPPRELPSNSFRKGRHPALLCGLQLLSHRGF